VQAGTPQTAVANSSNDGVAVLPLRNSPTLAYVLSASLGVLLPISALAGLVYGDSGLYDSYPADLAGLVGQDMVALVIIFPLLVLSTLLTARGSLRGLVLWTGALFWMAYYYFFYVVGGFNALFLVYIAVVSASLFALLSLLFCIEPGAFEARFGAGLPARPIGGFAVAVALVFASMWGAMVLASLADGTRPPEVNREVIFIDLTVMLPLLFYGGIRLWRREPWGYVLCGLLLVKTALSGFTLAFTTALGIWWADVVDPFQAFLFLLFALMMAGALALLVPYMRSITGGIEATRVAGKPPAETKVSGGDRR
jgi:hypothetical protein